MPERKYEWWSDGHSYAALIDPPDDRPHQRVFIFAGPDPEHRAQVGTLTFRGDELEGFLSLLVRAVI